MDEQTQGSHDQTQMHQAKPGHRTLMGVLAYLGILVIIPFLMAKDDPFVKFHIKQGLLLAIVQAVIWVFGMAAVGWQLWPFLQLVNFASIVLAIIGIVNVVQGHQKELPLIGSLAHKFTF